MRGGTRTLPRIHRRRDGHTRKSGRWFTKANDKFPLQGGPRSSGPCGQFELSPRSPSSHRSFDHGEDYSNCTHPSRRRARKEDHGAVVTAMPGCRQAALGPVVREKKTWDGQNAVEPQRGGGQRRGYEGNRARARRRIWFLRRKGTGRPGPRRHNRALLSGQHRRTAPQGADHRGLADSSRGDKELPCWTLQGRHRYRTMADTATDVALGRSDDVRALVRIPPGVWSRRKCHPKASEGVLLPAIPVTFGGRPLQHARLTIRGLA